MEEKKLDKDINVRSKDDTCINIGMTDEEIVKALEVCMSGKGCEVCPYFENGIDCVRRSEKDTLDLIHRLQSENEELKYARDMASKESKQFVEYATKINAKQKAEIERLTEKVENQKSVIKGQNKAIENEKFESKRLYDEYIRLDDFCASKGCICCVCENKKTCNECKTCGSLATEKCKGFKIDVSKYTRAIERADKLQKQVDELLKENARLDKNVKWFQEKIENGELVSEQAVKDTAKEICDLILEHWEKKQFVECDWLRVAIAEKYGVEVK